MYVQSLHSDNVEVQTQIQVFNDDRDADADELSHRYENVRSLMQYPLKLTVLGIANDLW